MGKYKIAVVQTDVKLFDNENNLARIISRAEEASSEGADLVCFPEGSIAGYDAYHIDRIAEMAGSSDGRYMHTLTALARRLGVHLLVPFFCRAFDGVRNTAFLIDDKGMVAGSYTKTHLIGMEKTCLIPGGELPVWDTALGKIGCLICYDICFPEAVRSLTLKGAQLVVVPSAWRGSSYYSRWWELNVPCRALDNLIYVAAVNRAGSCKDDHFAGRSMICSPAGEILDECGEADEMIIYADIDTDYIEEIRRENTVLKDMRTDLYGF